MVFKYTCTWIVKLIFGSYSDCPHAVRLQTFASLHAPIVSYSDLRDHFVCRLRPFLSSPVHCCWVVCPPILSLEESPISTLSPTIQRFMLMAWCVLWLSALSGRFCLPTWASILRQLTPSVSYSETLEICIEIVGDLGIQSSTLHMQIYCQFRCDTDTVNRLLARQFQSSLSMFSVLYFWSTFARY